MRCAGLALVLAKQLAQALSLRRSRVTWEKRIGIGDPPSLPVTTPLGTGVPGQGISLSQLVGIPGVMSLKPPSPT